MPKSLDVVGIGNAIVDVLAYTEDSFIEEQGLPKGGMTLVDEARSKEIYEAMGPGMECSGGSVANSLAGMAGIGARGAFIGKVFDDKLGEIFRHDMQSIGVAFDTPASREGKATACCLINVTPDAQRTMSTFIGASATVHPDDIDEAVVASAAILYIEGYMWDVELTKQAIRRAAEIAKSNDTKVAFSLSDTFCVDRHRDEFLDLIENHVDILFANEDELKALTQHEQFAAAKEAVWLLVEVAALTQGAGGSTLTRGDEEIHIHAEARGEVIDTTGAGDLYAAGVLYGLARGWPLEQCGMLGSRLAGHIITQLGARSGKPLMDIADDLLGQAAA